MLTFILIIISLLFLSFTISGSETAFFSLSEIDIRNLSEKHVFDRKMLQRLSKDRTGFLSFVLFFNTFVNVAFVAIADSFMNRIGLNFEGYEFVKVLLITFTLLVCGEVTPKALALYKRNLFLFLLRMVYMIYLFISPLNIIARISLKKGARKKRMILKEDMDALLKYLKENEMHVKDEVEFIERYNILKNKQAKEISVNRERIKYLKLGMKSSDVMRLCEKKRFSRIPVIKKNLDDIAGMLYYKDMIYLKPESSIDGILRKVHYIDGKTSVFKLLNYFLKNNVHIAILKDSEQKSLGLVTLSDIVDYIIVGAKESSI